MVMLCQVLVDFTAFRIAFASRFFKMAECCLQNRASCLFFLRMRARGGAGYPKSTDQWWKSEPLQHKCDEDDAERQKDNHVPLGERRAIRHGLGKRDSGCERYDATHPRPSNDKNVPNWRQWFCLVK